MWAKLCAASTTVRMPRAAAAWQISVTGMTRPDQWIMCVMCMALVRGEISLAYALMIVSSSSSSPNCATRSTMPSRAARCFQAVIMLG